MILTTPPCGSGCAPAGSCSSVTLNAFIVLPQAPNVTRSFCSRASVSFTSGSMLLARKLRSAGPCTTSSIASMWSGPPTPAMWFSMLPSTNLVLSGSDRWYTTLCFLGCSLRCEAPATAPVIATATTAVASTAVHALHRCLISLSFRSLRRRSGHPHARPRVQPHALERAQVPCQHIPYRRAVRLAEARPPRRLVAPGRIEGAPADADLRDAAAARPLGVDGVRQAAEPDHVAALTIVGVGVKEIVGHVLHHVTDLGPRHRARPRVRIRQRRVRVHVLERDGLPGQDRDAPAEAGGEGHLGVRVLEERVEDHLVERAVEVAAPPQERLRHGQGLGQPRLVRRPQRADERRHLRVGRNRAREDRDEPVTVTGHPALAHVEVEAAEELAVRAGVDDER